MPDCERSRAIGLFLGKCVRSFGNDLSLSRAEGAPSQTARVDYSPKSESGIVAVLCITALTVCLMGCVSASSGSHGQPGKQQSLNEWRRLTEKSAVPPKVFVNHNQIRFYFWPETNVVVQFRADLMRQRWPSDGYAVDTGPLVLEGKPSPIPRDRIWREARVISGMEWRQLATNLIGALTPPSPGHGAYYRGLLGGSFLYRDAEGTPRFGSMNKPDEGITIDHRYSIEETLQILARLTEQRLAKTHPKDDVFALMTPNSRHFPQPLIVDRSRRQCIW